MKIKSLALDHAILTRLSRFTRIALLILVAGCACTVAVSAQAATFALPADGNTIVGHVRVVTDIGKNTLFDIMRHFDLGYEEIVAANPGVSVWVPGQHQKIVAPTEFILPPKPWVGIVINVPQRRLYYFPKPKKGEAPQVMTFPLSIFRPGWPTPLGRTRIIAKYRDPNWIVPKSIQEEHRKEGESQFPSYFPPGPDNPMGMLAMQTGFPEIFIHGTSEPWGVGMRTSHGCFHLYPEDAAQLFPALPVGTPVRIINEPLRGRHARRSVIHGGLQTDYRLSHQGKPIDPCHSCGDTPTVGQTGRPWAPGSGLGTGAFCRASRAARPRRHQPWSAHPSGNHRGDQPRSLPISAVR